MIPKFRVAEFFEIIFYLFIVKAHKKKIRLWQPDFLLSLTIANVLKRKADFKKMSFTHLKCEHWDLVSLEIKIFEPEKNFFNTFL